MALADTALPYGLRDVQLFPLTGETAGAGVDLPNARTFAFSEAETFVELRGDDVLVALRGNGAEVDWTLDGGGVSFEAVKTIYGGTILESGTTPNLVRTFRKHSIDTRPYFKVEGQAISDSGGDFHCILYRCRATDPLTGTSNDGAFWITGAKGKALGRDSDRLLYDWVQNETETAIVVAAPANDVQLVTLTSATGGTFTLTFDGQTTTALAFNATADAVRDALEALSTVGAGNVTVTGSAGGPYTVTFIHDLGHADQPVMSADNTSLTGSGHAIAVTPVTEGVA